MSNKTSKKRRRPVGVIRAYERVTSLSKAYNIVAEKWRKLECDRMYTHGMMAEPSQESKTLWKIMEEIEEAMKEDDKTWRDWEFPNS